MKITRETFDQFNCLVEAYENIDYECTDFSIHDAILTYEFNL